MNDVLPRAVIFDWDNTLLDSWGAIADAMNATLAHFRRPLWTLQEVKAECTRSARESFPEWFGDRWQEASDVFYGQFKQSPLKNLSPLNGSVELLQWLSQNDIPAVIVSNKNGDFLRREAEFLGWKPYLAAIVGATDAPRDKPAREHADHALQLAGLKAGPDVWFAGDSEPDIACARNAGCTPVLIGHANMAQKLGVDMFFADCAALLALLRQRHRARA